MATKQRLNVLVVDRDEGSNIAIKDFLTERGYQAHVVTEPSEVMAEIKRGRFQLVLLDVSPPEPGGLDLMQQIREADSDICVIAMTGLASVEGAVTTLKNQAFDYLQKPLEMEELQLVIQAAIREKGLLVDLETRLNQVVPEQASDIEPSAARRPPISLNGWVFITFPPAWESFPDTATRAMRSK